MESKAPGSQGPAQQPPDSLSCRECKSTGSPPSSSRRVLHWLTHSGTVCPSDNSLQARQTSGAWESSQSTFFKAPSRKSQRPRLERKAIRGQVRLHGPPWAPALHAACLALGGVPSQAKSSRRLAPLDPLVATSIAAKAHKSRSSQCPGCSPQGHVNRSWLWAVWNPRCSTVLTARR